MPKKIIKTVDVEFTDVQNGSGWYHYDRKKHKAGMDALPAAGILVDKNEDFLVLAFSYNHSAGDYVGEFTIPMALVKRVKVLKTRTYG